MPELEQEILLFIQDDLGAESYLKSEYMFHHHGISSFQVLEVALEIEQRSGKKIALQGIDQDTFGSLKGLLSLVACH